MNKKVIVLMVGFLLFLAGCSGGNSGSNSGSSGSGFDVNSYSGGSDALTLEFAEGAPPEKIRDQGRFPFSVRILFENIGEYDIEENSGFVALAGADASVLGLTETSQSIPPLRGVKKISDDVRSGGKQTVTFSGLKYTENIGAGTATIPLNAYACYPYKTLAQGSLCLSGDTYQDYDSDVALCDIEGNRDSASSAAPVSVQNLEQRPAGDASIEFQFDIVHKPTTNLGRLFKDSSIESNCLINGNSPTSAGANIDEDYVYFEVSTGLENTLTLDCTSEEAGTTPNSGYARLYDDKATVYCTQDTTGLNEQQKLLKIDLSYDYLERISTDLLIEHAN